MNSTIRSKHHLLACIFVLIGTLLGSCATNSNSSQPIILDGTWTSAGLSETTVNNLTTFDGFTYATTDSGVYRRQTAHTNSWNPVGLQQKNVWDIVFLPNNKWLAALRIKYFSEGIPSLYLSSNQGESWQPYMNNFGGETGEYTWVGAIATTAKPSDTIFARVGAPTVVRSINGGESWDVVSGQWNLLGGPSVFVKADSYHTKRVWAGGVSALFQPYLLKSDDSGDTWKRLPIIENTEGAVYDIATHPTKTGRVLAGLGIIRKSSDSGKTWSTLDTEFGTLTFTHSARTPTTVYASGGNAEGTLFFAASGDFGDSWQTVTMADSPTSIRVNDMVSVMEDGQEVLYLGTNKGLYSYRFEE